MLIISLFLVSFLTNMQLFMIRRGPEIGARIAAAAMAGILGFGLKHAELVYAAPLNPTNGYNQTLTDAQLGNLNPQIQQSLERPAPPSPPCGRAAYNVETKKYIITDTSDCDLSGVEPLSASDNPPAEPLPDKIEQWFVTVNNIPYELGILAGLIGTAALVYRTRRGIKSLNSLPDVEFTDLERNNQPPTAA